jgi:hypothetical protein
MGEALGQLQYETIYLPHVKSEVNLGATHFVQGSSWIYAHFPKMGVLEERQIIFHDQDDFIEAVRGFFEVYIQAALQREMPSPQIWKNYEFRLGQTALPFEDKMWVPGVARVVNRYTPIPLGFDRETWQNFYLFTAVQRYRSGLTNTIDLNASLNMFKWNTSFQQGADLLELDFWPDVFNDVFAQYKLSAPIDEKSDNAKRYFLQNSQYMVSWYTYLREYPDVADALKNYIVNDNKHRLILDDTQYLSGRRNTKDPFSYARAIAEALNLMRDVHGS